MISVHSIESYLQLSTNGTRQVEELSAQQLTSCVPNPLKCGGNGGCSGSVCKSEECLSWRQTKSTGRAPDPDPDLSQLQRSTSSTHCHTIPSYASSGRLGESGSMCLQSEAAVMEG